MGYPNCLAWCPGSTLGLGPGCRAAMNLRWWWWRRREVEGVCSLTSLAQGSTISESLQGKEGERVTPRVPGFPWLGPQGPKAWSLPPQPFWGGCFSGGKNLQAKGRNHKSGPPPPPHAQPRSQMPTFVPTAQRMLGAGCVCADTNVYVKCNVPKPGDYTHITNRWRTVTTLPHTRTTPTGNTSQHRGVRSTSLNVHVS